MVYSFALSPCKPEIMVSSGLTLLRSPIESLEAQIMARLALFSKGLQSVKSVSGVLRRIKYKLGTTDKRNVANVAMTQPNYCGYGLYFYGDRATLINTARLHSKNALT
jgi:hypothetical protein